MSDEVERLNRRVFYLNGEVQALKEGSRAGISQRKELFAKDERRKNEIKELTAQGAVVMERVDEVVATLNGHIHTIEQLDGTMRDVAATLKVVASELDTVKEDVHDIKNNQIPKVTCAPAPVPSKKNKGFLDKLFTPIGVVVWLATLIALVLTVAIWLAPDQVQNILNWLTNANVKVPEIGQ